MPYLLDTNIAIDLRDGEETAKQRFIELEEPVLLSVVTRIELEGGVHRNPAEVATRQARLDLLLEALPVLAFGVAEADVYRAIVTAAGYSRRKLLDRMIAAQAVVHRATLITRNPDDFRDVPGLSIVAW